MAGRKERHEHYKMRASLDMEKKKELLVELAEKQLGYHPDIDNPRSFNEKIMWLKLYNQDPLITTCADKYAVKQYVADRIGEEHIVPTIGTWKRPEDIDFDALPDKFVLKVNWSSGFNIIVPDKSKLNKADVMAKLRDWIRPERNSYYDQFNWGYKNMKPVIYAEEYLEQIAGQVYDYKLYMCGGKFEYMFIATDRSNHDLLTFDFFDKDFNHLPLTYGGRRNAPVPPEKPVHFEEMIEYAEKLAEPFPFVRVDFYDVGDRVLLGEMTFYSGGAALAFDPEEWDFILGEKIPLPEKRIEDVETTLEKRLREVRVETKQNLREIGKKIVHKHRWGKNKYLVVGKLRIPYETHVERGEIYDRKYVKMLGMEVCYKKTPALPGTKNTGVSLKYSPNTAMEAYMMEDKITPEIQRVHCEQKAYKTLGYFPNLDDPKTLNEKIMWLALYYKNPVIAEATDKGKAKQWIADRVGEEYVVPAIGVYENVGQIDFPSLPKQFVAKLNDGWGSGEVMIVRNKDELNIDRTKAILSSWLYPWKNYYYYNMCITDQKMEKPTIVIEEFLADGDNDRPIDYKFYCCNGEPRFALVVGGRGDQEETRTFVDMNWDILPIERTGKKRATKLDPPDKKDEMIRLCRMLSSDVPFVRIDFYEVNGRIYVGEMTFTPGMFLKFSSKVWDNKLGEYIRLPKQEGVQH